MRTLPSSPASRPLPWPPAYENGQRERAGDWPLKGEQVARFDALLHEVHPDAPRVDADRLSQLARWLLSLPEDEARAVLDERLARIDQLRAMIADPDWDCAEADCGRVGKLLGYLDQHDNLIPDRIPLLGKLDDVLLLELAWPVFAAEAEDYRDFCAYRNEAQPCGSGGERRAAWIRDRLAEAALWQHHVRVNEGHYSWRGHPEARFVVGG
jgi:uncharacterized membrane protein YkvA (DUF1232 family)